MYPQNVTSGGKNPARSAPNIVLYPTLKMMALPVIAVISWIRLPVTVVP